VIRIINSFLFRLNSNFREGHVEREKKSLFFFEYCLIDEFFVQIEWPSVVKQATNKKRKNTCFTLSLSYSMCCCLCASNEEILFFHLVVSVSITASFSSNRTRKRTSKFLVHVILRVENKSSVVDFFSFFVCSK
jgi:hypothetical protein